MNNSGLKLNRVILIKMQYAKPTPISTSICRLPECWYDMVDRNPRQINKAYIVASSEFDNLINLATLIDRGFLTGPFALTI